MSLEFHDIQGIILSGYGHLPVATYLFLQMADRAQAQQWLARIGELTTSAAPWPRRPDGKIEKPTTGLNIAFTPQGLDKLGVDRRGFSTEFCEGIAGPVDPQHPDKPVNRSRRLGDTGVSDPRHWELGGPVTPAIDMMLMLFATDLATLQRFRDELLPPHGAYGLTLIATQDAYQPDHDREPFGFFDGLSQPIVEGAQRSENDIYPGTPPVKAGEFLLGYHNQYDLLPAMPAEGPLGRNSSYLVYRKLEQDVPAFWNFVYGAAKGDAQQAEWLAAKMVGRWRSGAPLSITPDQDDPELGADYDRNNCFEFAPNDAAGYRCPVGSHIRRSNPRDALQPGPKESLDNSTKHRIIRRGRVYGPAYPADVVRYLSEIKAARGLDQFAEEDGTTRGLIFVAINADIKRQFEFVQQTWANDPKFDGLYDNKDPLIGNIADDEPCTLTIQRYPVRKQLRGIPRFITLKAAGYFFLPSMSGLRYLATKG